MIERGAIHWVDLGEPRGSTLGKRRPVLVVQSRPYNDSRLRTVLAVVITSLALMPGNVFLPSSATGLPKDSAVNVTAIITLDKAELGGPVATLPRYLTDEIDRGLRQVLWRVGAGLAGAPEEHI